MEKIGNVPFPIEKPELIRFFIPDHTPIFVTILDARGRCKTDRLKDFGYPMEILWDDRPKGISSTMIRKAMITGPDWRQYVPSATYEFVTRHGIGERIRNS